MTNVQLDDCDNSILTIKRALRDDRRGPRVGDFCILLDGTSRRITYEWPGEVQLTAPNGDGSFYLGNGDVEFAGTLSSPIPTSSLVETQDTLPGKFWFFKHNYARAHNGVTVEIPCRVYRQAEAA